jgi:hypothetical protein
MKKTAKRMDPPKAAVKPINRAELGQIEGGYGGGHGYRGYYGYRGYRGYYGYRRYGR